MREVMPQGLPAAAIVDLDAIAANTAALRDRGGPLMAVVKADGYGHGLVAAAHAALAGGADWLGVAQLAEALQLRQAGISAPMLAWLTVPGDAFEQAVAAGIDLALSADWALAQIVAAARRVGRTARVHVKLDTGLNRNGLAEPQWAEVLPALLRAQAEQAVQLVGIFSHLAWADEPGHPTVSAQIERLHAAVTAAATRGARPEWVHLANSAATLTCPQARFDLVRPGLALYGLSPVPQEHAPAHWGLRPAMSLLARVAAVKPAPAGSGVSYGHTYTTAADTTVVLLPVGYADGVPRSASGTGPVRLGGVQHRIAGRVCMDQVVLDLGRYGSPDQVVQPGDVATLFGPDGPTAQDWAEAADTISYEIVTRIGARVPRIYIGALAWQRQASGDGGADG